MFKDLELQQLIKKCQEGHLSQNYYVREELLFYKGRLYIPSVPELKNKLVEVCQVQKIENTLLSGLLQPL